MIGHGGRLTVPARLTAVPTPRRAVISRAQAITRLTAIVESANLVLLYLPNGTDTTTSTESSANAATITWDADISSRFTRVGNGWVQSFNGTNQYGTVADHNRYSFGDGAADSTFTVMALARKTAGTGDYTLLGKWDIADEWQFSIETNRLRLWMRDMSVPAYAFATGPTQTFDGTWALLAGSHDPALGSGGTAADGIRLWCNGAAISATPSNNVGGTYVAKENGGASVVLGALNATGAYFPGAVGMLAVASTALTATQHAQIAQVCRDLYGIPL